LFGTQQPTKKKHIPEAVLLDSGNLVVKNEGETKQEEYL
jgi:hypothetical protein